MSKPIILITVICYLYAGAEQATKGNLHMGGVFVCYALANLLLIAAMS